ncbi:MAG: aminopeptidase [Fibrobacter sp.]|nr:aminopeptidase [Fibrobacter sp.]
MADELFKAVSMVLNDCVELKWNENMIILCDPQCLNIGEAFYAAGSGKCKEAVLVMITSRMLDGNEPPCPVASWIEQFDVAVILTKKSFLYTNACRLATEKGTRIVSMPGITKETLAASTCVDWRKLGVSTRTVASKISGTRNVKVKSKAGTDLSFDIAGKKIYVDDGRIAYKGAFGCFPAGEVLVAPVDGTAHGKLVIDSSFSLCDKLETPLVIHIKDGVVCRVETHECSEQLEKLFTKYLQPLRTLSEFGVGTLGNARFSGNVFEEVKGRGAIHFALGNNMLIGGNTDVPVHLDGVIQKPDVWLDNKLWIENGALV